jgi:uncharacterized 2Fe-2S/4Fe-4S cluster protein (DUF4445 family)
MPRITFRPDSRAAEVPFGERLLSAAWKAGVGIKSACGGRGKCGSCLVSVAPSAGSAALAPPSAEERALLPGGGADPAHRLACLCRVDGDIDVAVPPESQALRSVPRKPYTPTRMAVAPVVRRVRAAVEPAGIGQRTTLAGRLRGAIARAAGVRDVNLPLATLADFSLTRGFDAAREVTATLAVDRRVIHLRSGWHPRACGIAVDLGTTSIALFLCDLGSGEILAMRAAANPQAIFGEDVISRMAHVQADVAALATMRQMLVAEIGRILDETLAQSGVDREDVLDAVAVGNPTMQHILLGVNPEPLGRGPYHPVWADAVEVEAASLGLAIAPRARLHVLPSASGYIGGDTVAALLTRGPEFRRGSQLLVDIGTNGEVVLAHEGQLFATSCATGPVYEGAHIRCGVRASPGAIERVWVDAADRIRWSAIDADAATGDRRPVGLCGSGVISAVAALVGAGMLRPDGAFAPAARHPQLRGGNAGRAEEVVLVPGARARTGRDIVLTQQDVRAVQLGKSALRAGIEILLAARGVRRLDQILLAGTFGTHLEPDDLLRIGVVPPIAVERIRSIGNAAGDGARQALFSRRERQRAARISGRLQVLELSGREDFQDLFVLHTALEPQPAAPEG